MRHIILYLFRASVAFYFIYPAVKNIRTGSDFITSPFFKCFVSSYAFTPSVVALSVNIGFILLGLLILLWRHPLTPLILAILVLILELLLAKTFGFTFLMIIVPVFLVTIGLTIYYSHHNEW